MRKRTKKNKEEEYSIHATTYFSAYRQVYVLPCCWGYYFFFFRNMTTEKVVDLKYRGESASCVTGICFLDLVIYLVIPFQVYIYIYVLIEECQRI